MNIVLLISIVLLVIFGAYGKTLFNMKNNDKTLL